MSITGAAPGGCEMKQGVLFLMSWPQRWPNCSCHQNSIFHVVPLMAWLSEIYIRKRKCFPICLSHSLPQITCGHRAGDTTASFSNEGYKYRAGARDQVMTHQYLQLFFILSHKIGRIAHVLCIYELHYITFCHSFTIEHMILAHKPSMYITFLYV